MGAFGTLGASVDRQLGWEWIAATNRLLYYSFALGQYDWHGLDWIGLDWIGLDWIELD